MVETARERLKGWRIAEGLTQRQAAERGRMQQGTWSMLEAGLRSPTLAQAIALQELTGIEASAWPVARRETTGTEG